MEEVLQEHPNEVIQDHPIANVLQENNPTVKIPQEIHNNVPLPQEIIPQAPFPNCGACIIGRRQCSPNCQFRPYFSEERKDDKANAKVYTKQNLSN